MGASALVEQLFQSSWAMGAELANRSASQFDAALNAGGPPPVVLPATFTFEYDLEAPQVNIPEQAEEAGLVTFYELSKSVTADLTGLFATYISTYFPNDTPYLQDTEEWLSNALSAGGTGLNASIEAQIWDRDRSRVIKESQRMEDEALLTWSSRRYPLPPGAAAYHVLQVRKDAADKIAAASRDMAIKQVEMEIANVRFAVENSIKLYGTAIGAAMEYVKALAVVPVSAMQLIPSITDSQSKLIGAASDYYRAKLSAEELRMKSLLPTVEYDQKSRDANAGYIMEGIKLRVQAAVSAAQSLGTQAASSLNSLHASAGLNSSTSASNSIGFSYSNDTATTAPTIVNNTLAY